MLSILKKGIYRLWLWDARRKIHRLRPLLRPEDRILEIGVGPGSVQEVLTGEGCDVTGIDLADNRWFPDRLPGPVLLGSGENLPFPDKAFDVALLLTVLHHCSNPDRILNEAARVADRVAVIEDLLPRTRPLRLVLFGLDRLVNAEWTGHPHSNRDDDGWKQAFGRAGFHLTDESSWKIGPFTQTLYWLSPCSSQKEIPPGREVNPDSDGSARNNT